MNKLLVRSERQLLETILRDARLEIELLNYLYELERQLLETITRDTRLESGEDA